LRSTPGRRDAQCTVLAHQAKHPLALDRLDPEAMLKATINSFEGDENPLATLIRGLIK
jgi:cell filamentation protein